MSTPCAKLCHTPHGKIFTERSGPLPAAVVVTAQLENKM